MFSFKSDDYFKYLEKKNKLLKKENTKLKNEVETIRDYKNKYENLIRQVETQKKRYFELNDKLVSLIEQCKNQLDEIKK